MYGVCEFKNGIVPASVCTSVADPDPEWVKIKIWMQDADEHPGLYFREL